MHRVRSTADAPVHSSTVLGWREWVALPAIGVPWVKAKLDTGARSSALHAFDIEELDGGDRVRFRLRPWQDSDRDAVVVECPAYDRRLVRSSSGHVQHRYVVLIELELGGHRVQAETTLTNRDEMGFRMLVGRQALRQGGFVVDPGRSFVGGKAPRPVRRRNRGKA
ncbi:ATP-dependent zinc protease family protein [Humibacter ginsengisoli]